MTLHTGNYWHAVCGFGSAILGLETSTLTDAPERPLCKHCQKKRAQKEALEPLMETTEKPSYCPEHHKWVIRIYPGGRNKWEIVPEKWEPHTIQNAGLALVNGECAYVADRVSAEIAWLDYQQRLRWRDGR